MSFCDDREDIYSMALTVTANLLRKYNIDTASIGRLEVGTETLLDKSKSVKTVLMQLFGDNTSVEGVDTINACYGGTNAFFNSVNWVESSAWDGRDAIVVAGDIALYAEGSARPTGGAGAVALLIGPAAPIVVEPGLRGTYMSHVYDFYKPDFTSEYPYVDGHFSVTCYTEALDAAYRAYNERERLLRSKTTATDGHDSVERSGSENAKVDTSADRFDFMAFHAPTCKLVAKSYARLFYDDYVADPEGFSLRNGAIPAEVRDLDYQKSLNDKVLEKALMALTKKKFQERVLPSTQVPTNTGNMYTASLWAGLASLISYVPSPALDGKRIGMFSYGSGLAASLFSLRICGSTEEISKVLDVKSRLQQRRAVDPEVYGQICDLRKQAHLQKDYRPQGDLSNIASGVYYLDEVDNFFRRKYQKKP
ncbi:3-hydroxy-3-methylglutaryl coenzyme A synthase [Cytospora paraplurivora]|uniref:Hydroxymethylglutaryl-CoA synthase n=1 Tax=Cytospora paraplurivora TaxID=2898453 RepID=A0AAN9YPX9_9PEZI